MEERKVNTWEQFIKELDDLKRERDNSEDCEPESSLLFRGQENSGWWLSTTLERRQQRTPFKDYYRVISKIKPQIESLTNNQWTIPEYPEVKRLVRDYDAFNLALWSGRCPAYAYMAYLRHHGFPSPLLDWTRSPYVAAYFAFSKAIEDANKCVSIYIFSERRFTLSGNNMRVVYRYGATPRLTVAIFYSKASTRCASHTNRTGVSNNMTRFSTAGSINKESAGSLQFPQRSDVRF